MSKEANKWNVVFLVDSNPVHRVVMLRRSADKDFAPNFFTGIGGKIGDLPGFEKETPLESAYRELEEETEGQITRKNIKLHEFAQCVYESGLRLHYFYGIYKEVDVPNISPNDGTLVWVSTDELLDHDIIPTTNAVCEEWQKRGFSLDDPFTVTVRESGKEGTVRLVEVTSINDGIMCLD